MLTKRKKTVKKIIKNLLLGIFFVFGLNACAGVTPDGKGYTITVPLSVVSSTVAQNFPQSKKTNYGTLLIDKPHILGQQGSDKLNIGSSFKFSNMFIPNGIKGSFSLSSGVRYNPNDKGLYLNSPMIDDLTFQNFSLSKYLTPQMRHMISDVIAQQLMKKPIYHMNSLGASFVRGVRVKNGNLMVTVGL